jgi:NTP pyrophosphatase (non-canonical NTP hydrolase)
MNYPKNLSHDNASEFAYIFSLVSGLHHVAMEEKGFWPKKPEDETVLERLGRVGLIAEELGECMSGIRKIKQDDHLPEYSMEEAELADIILRVMDIAAARKFPLGQIILAKMAYNETRPYRHGDKKA